MVGVCTNQECQFCPTNAHGHEIFASDGKHTHRPLCLTYHYCDRFQRYEFGYFIDSLDYLLEKQSSELVLLAEESG